MASLTLHTNQAGGQAHRNYLKNNSAMQKNIQNLSTGYQINDGTENPSGLCVSQKLRAEITTLNAAASNVKDGTNLCQTAEGAMQEIQDMLNRLKELATESANGTYDDEVDREASQAEVEELLSEINRIAESTNFNDIFLLNGSSYYDNYDLLDILGSADFSDLIQGEDYLSLQIGNSSDSYQQLEVALFDMTTDGLGVTDFDVSTQLAALESMGTVEDAVNMVSTCRADFGALQNRLGYALSNLQNMAVTNQESESVIRDTDFAGEMMDFTKNSILSDTSQSMVAHSNQQTEHVMSLFVF